MEKVLFQRKKTLSLNSNQSRVEFSPQSWMRLDNAAKIYPAVQNDELTAVFRLSCILTHRVKIRPLLQAVSELEDRFPYYKVQPKKGFFWYYLEHIKRPMTLVPDTGLVCRSFEANELLFRILVRENKISVEFSHILTDGSGAFEFFKSLLLTYFSACGTPVSSDLYSLKGGEAPDPEESVDAFGIHFQKNMPSPKKIAPSFHVPFPLRNIPRLNVITGIAPLKETAYCSKQYGTSITVFLVAVYLFSLQAIFNNLSAFRKRKSRRILRIQVPVNLRKLYQSKTMRNFSLFVTPEIDLRLGQYSLEEIVKTVHHLMQLETDRKLINKIISRNVAAERNVVLKNTPLFVKSLILYFTYKVAGTSRYSGVITNLGKVSFGPEVDKLIDHFVFIPPPPNKTLKINCGVVGFGNKLALSFGNITASRELERNFFSILMKKGIPVKMINP